MEFEIGDDPQGVPDTPEASRSGGIGEPLTFRKERLGGIARRRRPDEIVDQMGEMA